MRWAGDWLWVSTLYDTHLDISIKQKTFCNVCQIWQKLME